MIQFVFVGRFTCLALMEVKDRWWADSLETVQRSAGGNLPGTGTKSVWRRNLSIAR